MPPDASLCYPGGRLRGVARLVRLRSTSSAPLLTLLGWYAVLGFAPPPAPVAGSAVSAFALMAYAQVFNDIRDRRLDAVSKPERPIPAGMVSVRAARVLAAVLAVAAPAAALPAGAATVASCLSCLILATVYSLWGKRIILVGNLIVAGVSAAMLGYGVASEHDLTPPLWIATAAIFLYILGNELFKVVFDAEGDRDFGVPTVANRCGRPAAAALIRTACAGLFVVYALAGLLSVVPASFAALGLAGVVLPTGMGAARLHRRADPRTFDTAHRWWRAAWIPGLLTLPLLR